MRGEGREWRMGGPRRVQKCVILAYFEWGLRNKRGVRGVERAREDGLRDSRWGAHNSAQRHKQYMSERPS